MKFRLKRYRDNHACLDYAIETGIKQGIEQGIERGREQGIEQGIEQGMSKKSQDIAKKMKTKGMDYSLISEFTGLSVDLISTL